jgi:hypothetical protein
MPHIQPGNYLVRSEVLGLHEGDRDGGAQFYMGCIQMKVTSAGGTVCIIPQPLTSCLISLTETAIWNRDSWCLQQERQRYSI